MGSRRRARPKHARVKVHSRTGFITWQKPGRGDLVIVRIGDWRNARAVTLAGAVEEDVTAMVPTEDGAALLLVPDWYRGLQAFSAETGEHLWQSEACTRVNDACFTGSERPFLVVAREENSLAVNPENGRLLSPKGKSADRAVSNSNDQFCLVRKREWSMRSSQSWNALRDPPIRQGLFGAGLLTGAEMTDDELLLTFSDRLEVHDLAGDAKPRVWALPTDRLVLNGASRSTARAYWVKARDPRKSRDAFVFRQLTPELALGAVSAAIVDARLLPGTDMVATTTGHILQLPSLKLVASIDIP